MNQNNNTKLGFTIKSIRPKPSVERFKSQAIQADKQDTNPSIASVRPDSSKYLRSTGRDPGQWSIYHEDPDKKNQGEQVSLVTYGSAKDENEDKIQRQKTDAALVRTSQGLHGAYKENLPDRGISIQNQSEVNFQFNYGNAMTALPLKKHSMAYPPNRETSKTNLRSTQRKNATIQNPIDTYNESEISRSKSLKIPMVLEKVKLPKMRTKEPSLAIGMGLNASLSKPVLKQIHINRDQSQKNLTYIKNNFGGNGVFSTTQEIRARDGLKLQASNPLSPYLRSNESKDDFKEQWEASAYDINIPDINDKLNSNLQEEPQGSLRSINIIDWPNAQKNMIKKKYMKASETVIHKISVPSSHKSNHDKKLLSSRSITLTNYKNEQTKKSVNRFKEINASLTERQMNNMGEPIDIKINRQGLLAADNLLTPQFSQMSMKPRAIHDNAILELEKQIANDQMSLINMMKAENEPRYNSTMGAMQKNQSAFSLGNTQSRINLESLHFDYKNQNNFNASKKTIKMRSISPSIGDQQNNKKYKGYKTKKTEFNRFMKGVYKSNLSNNYYLQNDKFSESKKMSIEKQRQRVSEIVGNRQKNASALKQQLLQEARNFDDQQYGEKNNNNSTRVKDSFGMFQSELTGPSNGTTTREQMRNKKSVMLRSKSAMNKDRPNSKTPSTPIDRSVSPQTLFGDNPNVSHTPLERKVLKSQRRIVESKLKNVSRTLTSQVPGGPYNDAESKQMLIMDQTPNDTPFQHSLESTLYKEQGGVIAPNSNQYMVARSPDYSPSSKKKDKLMKRDPKERTMTRILNSITTHNSQAASLSPSRKATENINSQYKSAMESPRKSLRDYAEAHNSDYVDYFVGSADTGQGLPNATGVMKAKANYMYMKQQEFKTQRGSKTPRRNSRTPSRSQHSKTSNAGSSRTRSVASAKMKANTGSPSAGTKFDKSPPRLQTMVTKESQELISANYSTLTPSNNRKMQAIEAHQNRNSNKGSAGTASDGPSSPTANQEQPSHSNLGTSQIGLMPSGSEVVLNNDEAGTKMVVLVGPGIGTQTMSFEKQGDEPRINGSKDIMSIFETKAPPITFVGQELKRDITRSNNKQYETYLRGSHFMRRQSQDKQPQKMESVQNTLSKDPSQAQTLSVAPLAQQNNLGSQKDVTLQASQSKPSFNAEASQPSSARRPMDATFAIFKDIRHNVDLKNPGVSQDNGINKDLRDSLDQVYSNDGHLNSTLHPRPQSDLYLTTDLSNNRNEVQTKTRLVAIDSPAREHPLEAVLKVTNPLIMVHGRQKSTNSNDFSEKMLENKGPVIRSKVFAQLGSDGIKYRNSSIVTKAVDTKYISPTSSYQPFLTKNPTMMPEPILKIARPRVIPLNHDASKDSLPDYSIEGQSVKTQQLPKKQFPQLPRELRPSASQVKIQTNATTSTQTLGQYKDPLPQGIPQDLYTQQPLPVEISHYESNKEPRRYVEMPVVEKLEKARERFQAIKESKSTTLLDKIERKSSLPRLTTPSDEAERSPKRLKEELNDKNLSNRRQIDDYTKQIQEMQKRIREKKMRNNKTFLKNQAQAVERAHLLGQRNYLLGMMQDMNLMFDGDKVKSVEAQTQFSLFQPSTFVATGVPSTRLTSLYENILMTDYNTVLGKLNNNIKMVQENINSIYDEKEELQWQNSQIESRVKMYQQMIREARTETVDKQKGTGEEDLFKKLLMNSQFEKQKQGAQELGGRAFEGVHIQKKLGGLNQQPYIEVKSSGIATPLGKFSSFNTPNLKDLSKLQERQIIIDERGTDTDAEASVEETDGSPDMKKFGSTIQTMERMQMRTFFNTQGIEEPIIKLEKELREIDTSFRGKGTKSKKVSRK